MIIVGVYGLVVNGTTENYMLLGFCRYVHPSLLNFGKINVS